MILNLTQHKATPEQVAAGVVDLPDNLRRTLKEHLTFNDLPSEEDISEAAKRIAYLAAQYADHNVKKDIHAVMIGGAPFLMFPLINCLLEECFEVFFAFSRREVTEEPGFVKKTSVFRHLGFVKTGA